MFKKCQMWALWLLYALIWFCWGPGYLTLCLAPQAVLTNHEPNRRDCCHLALVAPY